MAGVPAAVDLAEGSRRVDSTDIGWVVLALLVVLLVFELIVLLGSHRSLPEASAVDIDAVRRVVTSTDFSGSDAPNHSVNTNVVVGPRLQSVSGGRATFIVVVDQAVTSEGSQSQPKLVHTGLLVTVLEKDHKVAGTRVL